jgi:hypothetical protein
MRLSHNWNESPQPPWTQRNGLDSTAVQEVSSPRSQSHAETGGSTSVAVSRRDRLKMTAQPHEEAGKSAQPHEETGENVAQPHEETGENVAQSHAETG